MFGAARRISPTVALFPCTGMAKCKATGALFLAVLALNQRCSEAQPAQTGAHQGVGKTASAALAKARMLPHTLPQSR